MPGDSYSSLKVLHHPDRISDLQAGKQIVPVAIHWDLCSACPHACRWCAYRLPGYTSSQLFSEYDVTGKRRMPSYDKAIEIVNDLADLGVKAVEFTGGGEPTFHPHFLEIAAHAKLRGMDVALVTNGALLKPSTIEFLARSATWVRVSLDAATAETYCAMRQVSVRQWSMATSNLRDLCARRDEMGSPVTVGVGFVVSKWNWQEAYDCAKLATEVGANHIRLSACFSPEGTAHFDGFADQAHELCVKAQSLSDDRFRVFNLFDDRLNDLEQESPDYKHCYYQQFVTYIGGDLNVYRCCCQSFNERGLIGSIANQRFRDLWFSKEKHEKFSGFDASGCSLCMFNNKNRAVARLVEDVPEHVNFI